MEKEPEMKQEGPLVSFEDFKRLDLRIAEVVAAERVPKTDRLLKLIVRCPEERTVVAGLAEHYRPEDLIGKQVVLLANLKPAKIRGVVSQGMILAAKDKEALVILTPERKVSPGSEVG